MTIIIDDDDGCVEIVEEVQPRSEVKEIIIRDQFGNTEIIEEEVVAEPSPVFGREEVYLEEEPTVVIEEEIIEEEFII
ncbi:hypothetical protein Pmar_PMAR001135 [Perkinsus marinus ATCC 50983]|uniref:Uncharacterized protein n=1 Tax=Perkinsus marinus (strain ATCC 50983 / TXsc) TaxID=423536 RepID=C5KSY7_PERM5|nr:hypothetical protein Pmar_PMAR001135 [Perkinsus marinus ATCC 50983]EER12337.1 hypothetical protein Pmar_PMAR001135 [Perkinsus marinus ATCC 50983]|eukprot:XP_002780542.1 hypothetical protein Pmar_PMAR001135 [Perkinsus marinus ATCC 50983]